MKKKILSVILSVSMVAALMTGCGAASDAGSAAAPAADAGAADSADSADAAAPAADGEVQEIQWMFWDDLNATEDLITIGYKEVIDRYNETYAGKYHVTPVTTNLEEYDAKVNAKITAGDCPDVYICNPGPNLDVYVEAGACQPLDQYLDADAAWKDSFTDGIFERITYDEGIMAIPANFTAALCFYNTEIFEKVGVQPPTTFDELLDVCQKIQDAGITPITVSAGTPWCLSMVAGYICDREGGPDNLVKANAGEGDMWLDQSYKNAGEKLQKLSKYFQSTAAGDTNDVATAAFYNEEAAILIQGSWVIGQINGANPDFESKCGVFSFPACGAGDPNRMIVKTDNMLMSSTTKYPEACIALLKMFTDDEAQKYTAEVGGKFPVTGVDFDYDKAPGQLKFVKEILDKSTGTLGFYNESLYNVEAGDTFDNAFVSIALGQSEVEPALQTIQDWYEMNVY